jgi:DNA-binding MarR family transcriptional regulator
MKRTIREEIGQTRPFRSSSQEAVVALLRTAHLLRRKFEAVVEVEGITSQQYNVLRILRGARAPLPTMEISGRMIETSCGITRLVTTLEQKGLVRREQWAGDRRQYLCQITASGLHLLERLDPQVDAIDEALGETVDESRLPLFLDVLAEIRDQIGSESDEPALTEPPNP